MLRFIVLSFVFSSHMALAALASPEMPVGGADDAPQVHAQYLQVANEWPVQPSEAANLAQDAYPGATVLGVKLLSNGKYVVTLKLDGSVLKVRVDATSGAVG